MIGPQDEYWDVVMLVKHESAEKIIDYKLTEDEQAKFNTSAEVVRKMNSVLDTLVEG